MNFIFLVLLIVLVIEVLILRSRVAKLEKFKKEIERSPGQPVSQAVKQNPLQEKAAAPWARKEAAVQAKMQQDSPAQPEVEKASRARQVVTESTEMAAAPRPKFTEPKESAFGKGITDVFQFIKQFFTTGNVVLKVGIVVLFFGVAFLLKYAAQHSLISIELRLAGVGLGGVALLVIGWFLGRNRPAYGLVLQGGGVGILFLTVFASSKLYGLLPHAFSFTVMLGLVVLSCVLAVLQDSKSLAAFGITGGFLAPVLMSTGSGSHVMLFSYYAVLNSGIVGVAWFKAWRELNLVGFFFTFGISAFWGYSYYQPLYFNTTEPFLILFFLFYVVISVLFAHRQPVQLRGFIDGPIVFGLPIVAFGLQASLVESMEYGLAISALCLGVFYVLLATMLWNRLVDGMRMLTEAFLALGIVFGSLAIPFALDGNWTASAWALEGAAMVWVGLRQKRLLARLFGIILQVGAATSLLLESNYIGPDDLLFVNEVTMSCFLIAFGALFSGYCLNKYEGMLKRWESKFHYIFMGWGLLWWLASGVRDIEIHTYSVETSSFVLLFFAVTAFLVGVSGVKGSWQALKFPLLGFLPSLVFAAALWLRLDVTMYFFAGWGAVAWITSFFVNYLVLRYFEKRWPEKVCPWYHLMSLWLLLFMVTHDVAWAVDRLVNGTEVWPFVCWAIIPGIFVVLFARFGKRLSWPVKKYADHYLDLGVVVPLCFLVIWSVISNFQQGSPAPLPHVPLLNPLALVQIFVFVVLFDWIQRNRKEPQRIYSLFSSTLVVGLLCCLIFLWLNGVTARLVHLYFEVPFRLDSLLNSVVFQSAISILWSVAALTVTVWATQKGNRRVWFAGAVLLGCVVMKLFMVDLSSTGTIARIVSFIAVGLLMLLIGYFSPIPPKEKEEEV